MTNEEFQAILQRVRDGDQQAAHDLVTAYDMWLRRRIRQQLKQPLRRVADSVDVAQAAWMRFFENLDRARHMDTPEQFMAFMSQVAHNLLFNFQESFARKKRDLRRDQPLAEPATQAIAEDAAQEPSPVAVIAERDEWEQALSKRPPEVQKALRLLRDGHSHDEVGAAMGVPGRLVRRMIERVRSAPAVPV